ncbi:exocyst complex component EXO70I-like [Typha latifolia]|uniref:exocyst complex component EXO70I-like n=1 Tax=Typha latifolia TaxID=4733 RepID=UPI003C2C47CA
MGPATAGYYEDATSLSKLLASRCAISAILSASLEAETAISAFGGRLSARNASVSTFSDSAAPFHSQAIAERALHARIDRALAPSLPLLRSFSLVASLQRDVSLSPSGDDLLDYVALVDRLRAAIDAIAAGCDEAVRRLQEAVEFLSRTKATDRRRIRRLTETLAALKLIYEKEIEEMRFEGALDEALLSLQDQYEELLLRIKHPISEIDGEDFPRLGSDPEVEILRRISETLAANDCLDICVDIFIKTRYRRAAKALMRLNPEYLKTYTPDEIDAMEWESLESAIALWIDHLEMAVSSVLAAERHLCFTTLGCIMGGALWPECFAKIADKIMAVFFRFGEGVARAAAEPQSLFKLLDMLVALDRLRPRLDAVFDSDASAGVRARHRELQKLLVHAAAKVFYEFALQIEGDYGCAPPPADGSVPKLIRYSINYLKCLAAPGYAALMARVLQTKHAWEAGELSTSDAHVLLREALSNVLGAVQRHVEAKRSMYNIKSIVTSHIMAMNSYWYVYMRTRGSELAKLVGEETMKARYKTAAEEAAWAYQEEAWGPLVRFLEMGKVELFMEGVDENLRRHRKEYSVPDEDLREQIKEAVGKKVVAAYAGFLHANAKTAALLPPESVEELVSQLFEGGGEGRLRKREEKSSWPGRIHGRGRAVDL